jgi:hypothetical protein
MALGRGKAISRQPLSGYTSLDVETVTDLARLLAAPPQPKFLGCLAQYLLVDALFISMGLGGFGLFLGYVGIVAPYEGEGRLEVIFFSLLMIVGAIAILLFTINWYHKRRQKYTYEKRAWDLL